MPDSANILSILSALSGNMQPETPVNAFQGAVPPTVDAFTPPASVPTSGLDLPALPDVSASRPRRSLLDTIGRVADVFAKVGGADALYQPTLDSREDRTLALGDHERKVLADNVALETSKFDLGDKQNLRVGQAARGLKAIMATNPNADINQAWPAFAAQMHLDPSTTQTFGKLFAEHPEEIDGVIAAMTDPKYDQSKYGGSVVYGKDANGNLVAYQPSLGNDGARSILPDGITPIDPLKFVDTGGAQVGVGTRTGTPVRILPKSVTPDQRDRSKTAITIAGMPARAQAGKAATDNSAMIETAQGNLNELKTLYGDLHKMGAMVSPAQSKDRNVIARIRASGLGQTLEGAVGTEAQTKRDRIASIRPGLMQSLAKATGMTGKQLDSNADVKLFMQTVTDPTKSFEANMEAIAGLERFLKANAKKPSVAPAPRSSARPKAADGWTIVEVK